MREQIRAFLLATDGAVVADYVVFTAAIAVAGINSVNAVRNGMNSLSGQINASLSQAQVTLLCGGSDECLGGIGDPTYSNLVGAPAPDEPEATGGGLFGDPEPSPEPIRTEMLSLTTEESDSFVKAIEGYDSPSLYDAMLLHASSAQAYIDEGQLAYAAQYLDYVALITNTLMGRGDAEDQAKVAQESYEALLAQYRAKAG